ncbi:MAG: phosphopantetheine-binding protein [Marinifilaceae bacterium]|jgi:acyl carrier protein
MEQIIKELKEELIEALNLEDTTPDDLDENEALFGEGLGLDSIDALEIILIIERLYGIRMENKDKEIFYSIKTLAEYVVANKK